MISTVRTAIRSHALKEWTKDWSEEKRVSALRRIQPTPSRSIQILHKSVKRSKSSLITQMRTGKTGLKAFLYSRRVSGLKDEQCECGSRKETVRHTLIESKLFHKRRRGWWKKERAESPTGAISYTDMLTMPGYVSKAADFMRSTGLIGQYQALDNDQQQGFTRV